MVNQNGYGVTLQITCTLKDSTNGGDDYENQPIAFIDEFSKSKNVLADHLKIWADRYPFRAETKGSSRVIRPKVIIICSNYSIEQVFDEPED